jgi:hypothetical protein
MDGMRYGWLGGSGRGQRGAPPGYTFREGRGYS